MDDLMEMGLSTYCEVLNDGLLFKTGFYLGFY